MNVSIKTNKQTKITLQNWFKPIYGIVKYIVEQENRTSSSNRVLWNRALDRILYLPPSYLLLKVTSLLSSKCSHSGAESTLEFWTQGGNNNSFVFFLFLFLFSILKPNTSAHPNPTSFLEDYFVFVIYDHSSTFGKTVWPNLKKLCNYSKIARKKLNQFWTILASNFIKFVHTILPKSKRMIID